MVSSRRSWTTWQHNKESAANAEVDPNQAKHGVAVRLFGMVKSKAKRQPTAKRPPRTFLSFIERFPAIGRAHETTARAVDRAGPLGRKHCALIKIGISIGAGLESATRSHVRRAIEHGATRDEIEQAILLAMNTCGFPRTVAAWQWANEQWKRRT